MALRAPRARHATARASAALWFARGTATTLITRAADLRARRRRRARGGARRRARAHRLGLRAGRAGEPRQPGGRRLRGAGGRGLVAGPPALVAGGARGLRRGARASRWPSPSPRAAASRSSASSFWPALAAAIAVGARHARATRACVRIGVALYALAIVASFALATPMGGNVGAPRRALRRARSLAALAVAHATGARSPLLALPLLYWQWVAPVDDWARAAGDPSVHERYYDGLLALPGRAARRPLPRRDPVHRQPLGGALGRAARAAGARLGAPARPRAQRALLRRTSADAGALPPLARRQRRALRRAAPTRRSTTRRRARPQLVRDGAPYLREVWHDAHWRVFAVAGAPAAGRGAARATALEPERVRLRRAAPARSTCACASRRTGGSPTGRGCVGAGPGGWTRLRVRAPRAGRARGLVRPRAGARDAPRCTLSGRSAATQADRRFLLGVVSRPSGQPERSLRCVYRCSWPAPVPSRRGSCPTVSSTWCGRCCSSLPRTTPTGWCAGWIDDPQGADGGLRQRAPPHPLRADAGLLRRAQRAGVGVDQAGDHRLRQLDVPQLPDLGDPRRAGLPLPLPQPELLLRAQHVHGRHGHRARRLHVLPDRAAALLPRVGLPGLRLGLHRRQPRQRRGQRALQPLRRGAVDARRASR